jgi:transmembrane 9 superfamily protein 2/4
MPFYIAAFIGYFYMEWFKRCPSSPARARTHTHTRTHAHTHKSYTIEMGKNVTCAVLCRRTFDDKQIKRFRKFVKNDYRAHWLIDNLPSATKLVVDDEATYVAGTGITLPCHSPLVPHHPPHC